MDLFTWLFSEEFKLRGEVYQGSDTIYIFALATLAKTVCYLAVFIFLARALQRKRKVTHEWLPVWLMAIFLSLTVGGLLELTTTLLTPMYNLQVTWEVLAIAPLVLFLLYRKRYPELVGATHAHKRSQQVQAEVERLQQELDEHTEELERKVAERTARLERLSHDLRRTNEELEARTSELTALLDVFEVGSMNVPLEEFLSELIKRIVRGMNADLGAVLLLEDSYLVVRAFVGMGGAFEGFAWPVGQGFVGIIARECVSLAIDDAANDRRADNQYLRERQVASLLGTPLKIQQKMIGVIFVGTTEPHQFSTEEIRRFEVMAQRAATGVESIMMYTELRTTGEELAAKNRELESFVYTVSHDLKTPLVTLQGFVGSLVEDYGAQLDEVAHRYLDHIGEAAIRMEQLLSGLLNLSRIGRVIHPHTLVSFADVVNDALMAVAPRIEEHHIEMSLPSEWPHVFCDRQRMTEVMVNLLSNAVKFMGTQGSPRIEIGWEEQEENHCFYVKDNGVGIEPVYHQKIFEPFQRLGEVNGAEGTGLGLAIVKKIVEAHGGTVRVESQKRHGDTATRRHGDTATEADDSFAASPRPPVPASPEQGSTFYFTIPKRE